MLLPESETVAGVNSSAFVLSNVRESQEQTEGIVCLLPCYGVCLLWSGNETKHQRIQEPPKLFLPHLRKSVLYEAAPGHSTIAVTKLRKTIPFLTKKQGILLSNELSSATFADVFEEFAESLLCVGLQTYCAVVRGLRTPHWSTTEGLLSWLKRHGAETCGRTFRRGLETCAERGDPRRTGTARVARSTTGRRLPNLLLR